MTRQSLLQTTVSTGGITILVVDDEEPLRNLLQISLQRHGYHVLVARNGREALEIVNNKTVDLVLLDIMMPEMDGFTTCAELRKRSDLPIVMLTALNRPDDIVHGFNLGADDYITKPFTFREVEVRLQAILRRVYWN
ncbi:MAG: response regulator [Caldilineaceae bacterium]|nr:response regulator [Caldilineaceae bacterium]